MRVWLDWYESHRRVRLHSHPLRGRWGLRLLP
ncbi:Uncharacterised protein [Vibrio cholerae]|nr:Uncharacterised protein [Vibrio cholerae]